MRVILPFFGSRVSPNLLFSDQSLIIQIYSSKIVSKKIIPTASYQESDWIKTIEDFDINVLICGGVDRQFQNELNERNIEVINNVAGEIDEVLEHFIHGKLKQGYGISYMIKNDHELTQVKELKRSKEKTESNIDSSNNENIPVDCFGCIEQSCLKGESCHLCPLEAIDNKVDEETEEILEVAYDIAFEPEQVLCRVSELVYFCLGMRYKHIGIAFCTEMWQEAEMVSHVLKRFFSITPVCCKIGSSSKDKQNGQFSEKICCSPVGIANVLNLAKTELNVTLGLCIGCDVIFNKKSEAPVTTLFVKDKLLAHNPVGAIYTKYALEHLQEEF